MYMKKGESDPEVKDKLYKELSECEKYMYTMLEVPKAEEKFDCMVFRSQFKVRFEDLIEGIAIVEKACDETRNSEKLRKMMATILTLVNQINTGGEEGKQAEGFSLDALLKLNEVCERCALLIVHILIPATDIDLPCSSRPLKSESLPWTLLGQGV